MLRASLFAIIAILVLFVQMQCVTACASQAAAPPCHQQGKCSRPILEATATVAPSLPALAAAGLVAAFIAQGPRLIQATSPERRIASSPPGPDAISSPVLRI